jgi:hypothetical protein
LGQAREAYEGVSDLQWWLVCNIAHVSRGPLDHLFGFLQQVGSKKHVCAAIATGKEFAIQQLVCVKGASLMLEFSDLLADGALQNKWKSCLDLGTQIGSTWIPFAVLTVIEAALGYHTRIGLQVVSYPRTESQLGSWWCETGVKKAEPRKTNIDIGTMF